MELRNGKGMIQVQLAKELDTSEKSVGAWGRGSRTPRASMMQRIEDFF